MITTALAQLRIAASLGLGRPFSLAALEHLVESTKQTRREFGAIEAEEGASHLGGPVLDEGARRERHLRRFRAQASRAARETDYYGRLFGDLGLEPKELGFEDIAAISPTAKEALRDDPDAFVCRSSTPCFRTTTTGTTGKPTSVCFSEREMRSYVALSATSGLSSGRIEESDVVQLSTSSCATLGNTCFGGGCARIGALVHLACLIELARTLELLTEKRHVSGKKPKVSYVTTYASYLGELVECGIERGYGARAARDGSCRTCHLRAVHRKDTGVAHEVPQADDPLRAARRHPRGVPASGLFSYLPQLPDMTVLKGSLSASEIGSSTSCVVCFHSHEKVTLG